MEFSFNGVTKNYIRALRGFERPTWAPIEHEIVEVLGRPGGYSFSKKIKTRVINVPVEVRGESTSDVQKLKEDIAEWLITDAPAPLIFPDEPNRVYYAEVTGELNLDEILSRGKGVITFICPDPYKYGAEPLLISFNNLSSPIVIHNNGNESTSPTFDITLKKATTYLDIISDENYMRVGTPAMVGQTQFKKYEEVMGADGSSLVGWTDAGFTLDDGAVRTGTMITLSGDFVASSYGSGSGWHGPAKTRSIGTVLNNYVVRAYFDTALIGNQRGRTEVYLLDDANNIIGKVAAVVRRPTGVDIDIYIQNGPKRHVFITEKWRYRDFYGYLDIIKQGNVFTCAVAQQGVDENGKIYTRHKTVFTFNDLNNEFQKNLYAVGMHIGAYGSTFPTRARIRGMEVQRINQQSGIEYIGEAGDVFTFDHELYKIMKNGELFTRKDFGANFFELKAGPNSLVFNPPEVIENVDIRWRERYR